MLTKIVATMGPAWGDGDTFAKMVAAVDVCRLNFSHGTLDQHADSLRRVREAAPGTAILGDLCGPKIRVGQVADAGVTVAAGETLTIQRADITAQPGSLRISTNYPAFVDEVTVGDRVLIEDGLIRFVCTEKVRDEVRCSCTVGGTIRSSKGINLPGTRLSLPSITARDWDCVNWAIEHRLDYLALSFVRRADEIIALREFIRSRGSIVRIIAKIEMAEGVENIDRILEVSDGLMVARGDLGVEMDAAQVPLIQKDLVRKCRRAVKPCIVATQMLQSMVSEATPTRAEVSDVANAIFDGADAVMLSGETSVGKYPLAALAVMAHVADVTEAYIRERGESGEVPQLAEKMLVRQAVVRGVREIVKDLDSKAVVVWSETGGTARIFSKTRFSVPIVAMSEDDVALRRMKLFYGVFPVRVPRVTSMAELVLLVDRVVRERSLAKKGDLVVVVGGAMGGAGEGAIAVHEIP
jgi:pyruvate kinase